MRVFLFGILSALLLFAIVLIVMVNPAEKFGMRRKQVAEAEQSTLASYEQSLKRVQEQKQRDLAKTAKAKSETRGLITGVVYTEGYASALIGRELVHEGEQIHGATVVKIHKDKVEFEKNGMRWSQAVQQKPTAYWK